MTIFTNRDTEHEGKQWWSEVVDRRELCWFSSPWCETEEEAEKLAADWLRKWRKEQRQMKRKG